MKRGNNIKIFLKACTLLLAQLMAIIMKPILDKKNIWLISEKKTEARDNGFHFFKYLRTEKRDENVYYVIKKEATDRNKVLEYGNIISYDSFKHCVYYYASKYRACSQIHGVRPFEEYSGFKRIRFYYRKDQKQIYLTHGIAKDYRDTYDFRKNKYDLMICGAEPEYDYYKSTFNYPDKNIALTGLCRFDSLYNTKGNENIILVMPTFRSWLKTKDSSLEKASIEESEIFKKSFFYKFYSAFLLDKTLNKLAQDNGYKIIFYMHYTFQPYSFLFDELLEGRETQVIVGKRREYDVQELLKKSALLITDYSSVFFDFAYMRKPVIYAQFDEEEYRRRHYQEGWFVYKRDAFGPLCHSREEVILWVERLITCNMKVDFSTLQMEKKFFKYYDNDNCKRVFEAIMRLNS